MSILNSTFARKSLLGAVAALTLGTAVAASTTEASAQWRHRGGGWGGPVAAGVIGGLALGAIASQAYRPAYGYNYGYAPAYGAYPVAGGYDDECRIVRRPLVDQWGRVVRYQRVTVCD